MVWSRLHGAGFYGSLLTGVSAADIAPRTYASGLGTRPVLVFHGDRDSLIPIEQGRQLFEEIPGPKEFIQTPGAEHVQSYAMMGRGYEEKVIDFFMTHLRPKAD
jgi:fermentation-respiration switch protein FrsA (DUF1100 family)